MPRLRTDSHSLSEPSAIQSRLMRVGSLFVLLALVFTLAPDARGDWFAFGGKLGAPFTEVFEAGIPPGINTSTTTFTIGPTAELRFPFGLGVEADILYKRSRVEQPGGGSQGADSWEFPLLAKYRLAGDALHPYGVAGFSFRKISDVRKFVAGLETSTKGFVLGAGLEIGLPVITLQPEIRYTRWGEGLTSEATGSLMYNRNQMDFLFGIVF